MGIIGLDGQQLDSGKAADLDAGPIHDENAELAAEAGKEASDIDATDELGVPYFYPLDWKEEEKRGQRVPDRVRREWRKETLREQRRFERYMDAPVKRREVEAMFNNSIAPIGRQTQTVTFQFIALRNLISKKLGITEDEIRDETAKVIKDYREKSAQQAAEQAKESAEAALNAARERGEIADDAASQESAESNGDGTGVPAL